MLIYLAALMFVLSTVRKQNLPFHSLFKNKNGRFTPQRRNSRSPSPSAWKAQSRSRSRSRSVPRQRPRSDSRGRGRSRSRSPERVANATNPGNTLYVTGLSSRVTERDLEDHFNKEGKVASCFLVVEPRTRISCGFIFVTMDSHEDAERCMKYLNQSVLEGRYITVEQNTLHQLCWQQSEMTSSYPCKFSETA
ncbi:RNA-binding (RRM/RBD/RNP motifs) family protein [Trifolium repens]|nr:RNA-binding (RRM/RBD/RNP motifs) family protein [Trifolium repens]